MANDSFHDPKKTLGEEAQKLGMSVTQVRAEAKREMTDWLAITGEPADRFDNLLGH